MFIIYSVIILYLLFKPLDNLPSFEDEEGVMGISSRANSHDRSVAILIQVVSKLHSYLARHGFVNNSQNPSVLKELVFVEF